MIKKLLSASASLALAFGVSHAAIVVDMTSDVLSIGDEITADMDNTRFEPGADREIEFRFAVADDAAIQIGFSASSAQTGLLERIRLGGSEVQGDFSLATSSLDSIFNAGALGPSFGGALPPTFNVSPMGVDGDGIFSIYVTIIGDDPLPTEVLFDFSGQVIERPDVENPVPVPAAGLMMLTALGGFGIARRRRQNA